MMIHGLEIMNLRLYSRQSIHLNDVLEHVCTKVILNPIFNKLHMVFHLL